MKRIDKSSPIGQALFELAWVPKPFLSDLEWSVANALVNNKELGENLPLVTLNLDSITTTQSRLDHATVKEYADKGNFDNGLVFHRDGFYYLYDGHHRYFAAQLAGETTAKFKVVDMTDGDVLQGEVGPLGGMTIAMFAYILGKTPDEIITSMDGDDRRIYEVT